MSDEEIIAKCYIHMDKDENNVCFLSKENLFVRSKGILNQFQLGTILNISFKRKLLLMPVVFGGIISPFSMIALFNGYYNVWLMLSLVVAGLALLYYGIEGSQALSIQTNIKEYDFFVKTITPNLRSFVSFIINFQHRGDEVFKYYFALKYHEWDQAQTQGYLELDYPLKLNNQRISLKNDEMQLAVDLSKLNMEVVYKMDDEQKKLVPVIEKRIPTRDIIIPE